jgi:site-specific DNA-methyltransferase (adenine-specific)
MLNNIIHGDCLIELDNIEKESVDLIYLDPPFFTEKKFGEVI